MIHLSPHPELHPLFETLAYALGFAAFKRARRNSGDVVNDKQRWSVIAAATGGALLGSRLLGLLEQAPRVHFSFAQFISPGGGKTVVGGLLGGWLGVEIVKRLERIKTRTGDLFAIPLCIGIGVGRIGCLLAGLLDDTYGTPTTLPWGVDFGDGILRHPTQAYEMVFVAMLALALLTLRRRCSLAVGTLYRVFLSTYLAWRLLIDCWKPEPLVHGLTVVQWACVGGLIILIASKNQSVTRHTKANYV